MAENRVTQVSIQAIITRAAVPRVTQVSIQALLTVNALYGGTSASIASAEAFGTGGAVIKAEQTLSGVAIASAEAFDTGEVKLQDQSLVGVSIASTEAFGTGVLAGPVGVEGDAGIGSAESFGTGTLSGHTIGTVADASIPSAETFDTVGASVGGSISGPIDGTLSAGIASAEAFGTGKVAGPVGVSTDASIDSAEAFGTGVLFTPITGTASIASAEAFGSNGALVSGLWSNVGIESAESFGTSGAVLQFTEVGDTLSKYALYIAGKNWTGYLKESSVKIERQLNFTGNATFALEDENQLLIPPNGGEVLLFYYDEVAATWQRLFGGKVATSNVQMHAIGPQRYWEISCSDYANALSRRFVNKKYPAAQYGTFNSIMRDLQTSILAAEGITWVERTDPGVTIGDIEFNYVSVKEALDQLVSMVQWEWQCDFHKNLFAYDRPAETETCPYAIKEDNTELWRDAQVSEDIGMYRNRQLIKANFSQTTSVLTKDYVWGVNEFVPYQVQWNSGILVDRTYYGKLRRIISVKHNGNDQTWFLQDQSNMSNDPMISGHPEQGGSAPAGWQWMQIWNNDLQLVWNVSDPVIGPQQPTSGTLTITFEVTNDLPEPVVVEDAAEIAARRAVEGGSGIYEAVEEVVDIQDRNTLVQYAQGLLDRFKVTSKELTATIDNKFGFHPGQAITVHLPTLNIPAETEFTIDSVSLEEIQTTVLQTTIKASNKIQQRDALASFDRLMKRLRKPANKVQSTITFHLAETIPGIANPGLDTGTNMTVEYIARRNITLVDVVVFFKTPPTGADAIFDIKAGGVSIFPASYVFNYPAGTTELVRHSTFNNPPLTITKDTRVTIDVTQVGSDQPGKDCTIVITGWV